MARLFDKQLLFVAGKGGVGRTSVAAAMALAAHRQGRRVLVAMCHAKERLSRLLGTEPIGTDVRELEPGLSAVDMAPAAALEEYAMMVLHSRTLYRAIFENPLVASFLRGTPGLSDWAMMGKAVYHADQDLLEDGARRYDLVIVDGPATGHAVDMLRMPRVIQDASPPGLLRRGAEHAWGLLTDPARAGVVLVTLPEDMPVNEAIELHGTLTALGLPVPRLVVNGVLPPLFRPAVRAAFEALPERLPPGSPLGPHAAAARRRAIREGIQDTHLTRLRDALPLDRTELPRLFVPQFGRDAVEALSYVFD